MEPMDGQWLRRAACCMSPLALLLVSACGAPEPSTAVAPIPAGLTSLPAGFVLAGAERNDLQGALGEPSLAWHDWPAEYRRYDFGGCSLDLYLYGGKDGSAPRVSYWEVRSQGEAAAPMADSCRWLADRLGTEVLGQPSG